MSLFDYENFKKSGKLYKIHKNVNFCLSIGINLLNNDLFGKVLNYHCFRFTKMREEIYFIQCNVMYKNETEDKYINTPFIFLVNEESFWKRFRIYLKDSPNTRLTSHDTNIMDFLNKLSAGTIQCNRIELNVLPVEQKSIDNLYNAYKLNNSSLNENKKGVELITKDNDTMYSCIKNGAICNITGFFHYNKRICIDLFSGTLNEDNTTFKYGMRSIDTDTDVQNIFDIDDSKYTYMNTESWFYYDPEHKTCKQYESLY